MNCYLYGLGPADDRQWLMVDLGITFPEGENDPGVDVILPDLRFIEEERGEPRRARAHARARGSHRRRHRAVAAAEGADLCHAVHGGAAAKPSSPSTAAALKLPIHEVALNGRFDVGPFGARADLRGALDPGVQCAGHPHAARLVLHTGDWKIDPTPVIGAADRQRAPRRARRRGRDGDDLRFHQCAARGPLAVRAGCGALAGRASSRAPSGAWP